MAKGDKEKIQELLKKSAAVYNSSSKFEMDVAYTLYSTATSNQVTESYTGTISKNGPDYYTKIENTEFIQVGKSYIKIDHKSKAMEYTSSAAPAAGTNNFYSMANQYLDYYTGFELLSEGNLWKCTLSTAQISLVPYSKVIIYIDKNSYRITKQILHLLVLNEYNDGKGGTKKDYPRLEIVSKNFTEQIINASKKFSLNNYVSIDKNKVSPASRLSTYTFIDLTKK